MTNSTPGFVNIDDLSKFELAVIVKQKLARSKTAKRVFDYMFDQFINKRTFAKSSVSPRNESQRAM